MVFVSWWCVGCVLCDAFEVCLLVRWAVFLFFVGVDVLVRFVFVFVNVFLSYVFRVPFGGCFVVVSCVLCLFGDALVAVVVLYGCVLVCCCASCFVCVNVFVCVRHACVYCMFCVWVVWSCVVVVLFVFACRCCVVVGCCARVSCVLLLLVVIHVFCACFVVCLSL